MLARVDEQPKQGSRVDQDQANRVSHHDCGRRSEVRHNRTIRRDLQRAPHEPRIVDEDQEREQERRKRQQGQVAAG
jgi:hypothetical protein